MQPAQPYLDQIVLVALRPHVKRFETEIWFGKGLCHQVRGSKVRGQVGKAGEYQVLLFTMAGRTMFSFIKQDQWLSLMVAEDSDTSTMGLHETSLEPEGIVQFIDDVIKGWNGVEDSRTVNLGIA